MNHAAGVALQHSYVNEGILLTQIRNIFPQKQTYVNDRKRHNVQYTATSTNMEFDIWIPDIKLCFEFQDSYHYITTWYNQFPQASIVQKDRAKGALIQQQGLTLVIVPCWWNGSVETLRASIFFHRPDLVPGDSFNPIPANPPSHFFVSPSISGVGELMLASFPIDSSFKDSIQGNVWWMGEKYDGVRCCWNSKLHTMYSRNGRELFLEQKFTNLLPKLFIDGELWFGRGHFYFTYMLINQTIDLDWSLFRMVSFDVPSKAHHVLPFEKRFTLLLSNSIYDHSFNVVVSRVLCTGALHLARGVENVLKHGGEGVILRKRGSKYENGRSQMLIKLKAGLADREAIVVGSSASELKLKLPNGTTFNVPMESVLITTPDIGEIVSFFYETNARRDKPVNPKVYRTRGDISWEEVVHNFVEENKDLSDTSVVPAFSSKPIGFWTNDNMRAFLEEFAKSKNLDPLLSETWYTITRQDIAVTKEGKVVLRKFKGYLQALEALFPDIELDRRAIKTATWGNIESRRHFFERYAKENNFDPQNTTAWYSQSRSKILSTKGALGVVSHHKNSVVQALLDLFPNIGLDKPKFYVPVTPTQLSPSAKRLQKIQQSKIAVQIPTDKMKPKRAEGKKEFLAVAPGHWQEASNRRRYMEWLGKELGYSNWEDWYQIESNSFHSHHGTGLLFHSFHNSPSFAVVNSFPEHKWERFKFRVVPHGYWDEKKNQRGYLEWLSDQMGYKNWEDWYKIDNTSFVSNYGAGFLKKYRNSPRVAVTTVYSEHPWVISKFVGKINLLYRGGKKLTSLASN